MNKKNERKRIERMLQYRIRGYSLNAIAGIFKKSREGIRYILNKYQKNPEFKEYYKQIRETQEYLLKRK